MTQKAVDNTEVISHLHHCLDQLGYQVNQVSSQSEMMEFCTAESSDLLLIDSQHFDHYSRPQVLAQLKEICSGQVPLVVWIDQQSLHYFHSSQCSTSSSNPNPQLDATAHSNEIESEFDEALTQESTAALIAQLKDLQKKLVAETKQRQDLMETIRKPISNINGIAQLIPTLDPSEYSEFFDMLHSEVQTLIRFVKA